MADHLGELADIGVSVWLDDLSRRRLATGGLRDLVERRHVVGVTTNPSIFAAAVGDGGADGAYGPQIRALAGQGADADLAVRTLTTDDVRSACDVLRPVFDATGGVDGRVSVEVDPRLAHDTHATVDQALELAALVDRPNAMIKIPATPEGLPAITRVVASGVSVNITLIFSVDQYRQVVDAWEYGLEQAARVGADLSTIHSVASFFVSRVDTAVDARLDAIAAAADPDRAALARRLRSLAGVANARLAFEAFQEGLRLPRWTRLAEQGAHPQRPLWASTGVKDPTLPDTYYVQELAAPGTVDTMPEKTLRAAADGAQLRGDAVTPGIPDAHDTARGLESLGIDMSAVADELLVQGVQKFEDAWNELLASVGAALEEAR